MSLINDINRVFDVTEYGVRADPDARRGGPPPVRPPGPGRGTATSNMQGFKDAIARLYLTNILGNVAPKYSGTLYVPPGRYLIEFDPAVQRNWRLDFSRIFDTTRPETDYERSFNSVRDSRKANPFGAAVQFPEGITLWLAPGAASRITSRAVTPRRRRGPASRGAVVFSASRAWA